MYSISVIGAAVLVATLPLLLQCKADDDGGEGPDARHHHDGGGIGGECELWLERALALVVIACPCSLVVAMPITHACGVSALARWGVLVKSSRQLDALASVRSVAFDKTGTLTEGRFRLHQMVLGAAAKKDEGGTERVMRLAAAVEALSSHPIAAAFLEFAEALGVEVDHAATGFEVLEGEGVTATVDGVVVHVGSEALARRLVGGHEHEHGHHEHVHAEHAHAGDGGVCEHGHGGGEAAATITATAAVRIRAYDHGHAAHVEEEVVHDHGHAAAEAAAHEHTHADGSTCGGLLRPRPLALSLSSAQPAAWAAAGASVLWVLADGEIVAACKLSDRVRGDAKAAVAALHSLRVGAVMLTGDSSTTAESVGAAVRITDVRASLTPQQKLEAVREVAAGSGGGDAGRWRQRRPGARSGGSSASPWACRGRRWRRRRRASSSCSTI